MLLPSRIVGKNIELHKISKHDAAGLFALINKNRQYLEKWLDWVKNIQTIEDEIVFLADALLKWDRAELFVYMMNYEGHAIGTVSIFNIDYDCCKCEIGYWIDSDYQGMGIASEAVAIVEEQARTIGLTELLLIIDGNNLPSLRIAEKLSYSFLETVESTEKKTTHCIFIKNTQQ